MGAIRHGGFIPWDDDIDIVMMREDYELFCKEFIENPPENLKLCNIDTVKGYYLPITKIIDTRTVLVERQFNGCEFGVYIDIFPLDAVSEDPTLREKYIKDLNRVHTLNNLKKAKRSPDWPKSKQILFPLIKLMLLPITMKTAVKMAMKQKQKYSYLKDSGYVVSFAMSCEGKMPRREYFSETVEMKFEDKVFCVLKGYDGVLTDAFGDYMKLPPEDKRVSHHSFEAWWK